MKLAREEDVEFLDIRGPAGEYIRDSGKPYSWFTRDPIHANVRGGQVLARILEAWFAPEK
jgi:hypothetical protein